MTKPVELARLLTSRQLSSGGWSFSRSKQESMEATCLAALALGTEAAANSKAAITLLLKTQLRDGSWPAFQGDSEGSFVLLDRRGLLVRRFRTNCRSGNVRCRDFCRDAAARSVAIQSNFGYAKRLEVARSLNTINLRVNSAPSLVIQEGRPDPRQLLSSENRGHMAGVDRNPSSAAPGATAGPPQRGQRARRCIRSGILADALAHWEPAPSRKRSSVLRPPYSSSCFELPMCSALSSCS